MRQLALSIPLVALLLAGLGFAATSCSLIADVPTPTHRDADASADGEADEAATDADVDGDGGPDDAAGDGCGDVVPSVPLPLSPENGSVTGSLLAPERASALRPRLRWRWAGDACGPATFDVQVDDSCTTPGFADCSFSSPEAAVEAVAAVEWRPGTALAVASTAPVGRRYYWRVRACRDSVCSAWSAVRWLDVGRAPKDYNGDGYSDVVVGADTQDAPALDEGNVFVYYGGAPGVRPAPDLTLDNPMNQAGAEFGNSVRWAGDLNADGFGDLVVSSFLLDNPALNEGGAFVYYGSAAGIPSAPDVALDSPDNLAGASFGSIADRGGDVDGDGFGDLILGCHERDAGGDHAGRAFIFFGSAFGIGSVPDITLFNPASQAAAMFGASVATAGDVNGDGFADVVVGAPGQDAGATDEGNAFLYLGSGTAVRTTPAVVFDNPTNQPDGRFGSSSAGGDFNGDGFADLVVGACGQSAGAVREGNVFVFAGGETGPASSPTATLDNPANQDGGEFCVVSSTGDVSGDGYSDVVIGAWAQDAPAADEGNAFLFLGGPEGLPDSPSVTLDNPDDQPNGRFGTGVTCGGDVNGDGFADVVVGAYYQGDPGEDFEGQAFLYLGGASGIPSTPALTLDNPADQPDGRFGVSVALGHRPDSVLPSCMADVPAGWVPASWFLEPRCRNGWLVRRTLRSWPEAWCLLG